MLFGLTRGEILLIVFVFGLVYISGLLPKMVKRLSGDTSTDKTPDPPSDTSETSGDG